ncbi:MAG TPA: VCBS repeat-containing protein [Planctomycetota bacterium]|nr:VCBS repeat-containing protein [Planctomycetota bacterium]HRR80244.1 VCBS repeat-containing protein [Planctomycetota bacterium]HRT93108.1 VCBS repeat-containing protein [Planctomycetota bacterium]
MRKPLRQLGAATLAALLACSTAQALIRPDFTPIHLVHQSDLVLALTVGPVGTGGAVKADIAKALKGKAPAKAPVFDFSKSPGPQVEAFQKLIGPAAREALFFTGRFRPEVPDGAGAEPTAAGLLHVRGHWFRFVGAEGGVWLLDALDSEMEQTWAGGTDMLRRAVDYILTDPAPSVPVKSMANWLAPKQIARLDGTVRGAIPVDLAGDGRLALHLLSDAGDRILLWNAQTKALDDMTPRLKLGAKSRCAAWADLDADGRLDLASFDGEALTLWLQAADGAFAAKPSGVNMKGGCLGLAPLGLDDKGRVGLVVSTASYPLVVAAGEGGGFEGRFLVPPVAGKFIGSGLGAARPCLVADLDGDALPDVLQPFAKGGVFYKGRALGAFEGGALVEGFGTGEGDAGAFVGDFDADGLLDVFVAGDERPFLWHNRTAVGGEALPRVGAEDGGRGRETRTMAFEETLPVSGEIAYISKPGGIGGMAGDPNGDGRQDVFIVYSNRAPHIFFNRGFRSFGHAHELDLDENRLLEAAKEGQQAGCLADLDGDGAQDMALVLKNGELWVCLRDAGGVPPLALRAALPPGGYAGPLTVTAWADKRCLGAWNVSPGTADAFFGVFEPGPLKLRWQFPGKPAQEKQLIVEDKPIRFVLKP